jgi:glycosyltransferase involved in cell wall biosynthesis
MIIGIDTSRAFIEGKTGTENYSYNLVTAILRLPESKLHTFVLFTRLNPIIPKELNGYSNVIVKVVKWPYLWTQMGLAWETWYGIKLDVLWVPAHTLPVLRNPRIKTVVTIHGLEYQWLPEYKNLLQRWYLPLSTIYAAKYADRLIAVSKFTAKQLVEQLHTSPKKIKVIHEGVVASTQCHSNTVSLQKYGLEYKKYVLFVGSVQPRKNLVALVEAFSLIAHELPGLPAQAGTKLVIAGGIGWMAEEVLNAPSRYNVQEKVVFTGRVSDSELRELYLGATAYVQPSITEGFGLPVLEAMSHGVPVISSDGGALPEVVGEAGIVVPINYKEPFFVKNLAGVMKRVIKDKRLQKKLISMGYERIKEFSWEKAAKVTLAVLVGEGYK